MTIEIYLDSANVDDMRAALKDGVVSGFTTNPTIARRAGIVDYEAWVRDVLAAVTEHPISFEVFADDFGEMEEQARKLAALAANVYVKIPITNTRGESAGPLIKRLAADGAKVNVTAILTSEQVRVVACALNPEVPAIVSVFAGRIADTGRDPVEQMATARRLLLGLPLAKLLWASPREALNIAQAEWCGAHIITVTPELLAKWRAMRGKDLAELSLATVKMFRDDAVASGYTL